MQQTLFGSAIRFPAFSFAEVMSADAVWDRHRAVAWKSADLEFGDLMTFHFQFNMEKFIQFKLPDR